MDLKNELIKEENSEDIIADLADILARSEEIKMWNSYYLNEARRWERD